MRSKCFSAPGYMEQFNSYEPFSSPPASPSGMRKKLAEDTFQDPFAKIAPVTPRPSSDAQRPPAAATHTPPPPPNPPPPL